MAEGEVLEVIAAYTANSISAFTVYISFTFGFLMLCYFVGAQLSRVQVLVASALYVMSAGSAAAAMAGSMRAIQLIQAKYTTVIDTSILWDMELWIAYLPGVLVCGIVASIYVIYDIRRNISAESNHNETGT